MEHGPGNDTPDTALLAERLDGIATWLQELDSRVRATEVATGDEKTAKELRKAIEALAKHDPKLADRLTNQVDVLADRVASLAGTVSTTAAALAGKDGELAGLRRDLARANARMDALLGEVQTASGRSEIDELRRAIARLSSERALQGRGDGVGRLEEKLTLLGQRVDTLAGTVSTTAAGLAGRDGDVAALQRRLEEESVRTESAIAVLQQAVDPAPMHELRSVVEAIGEQAAGLQEESRRGLIGLGVDLDTMSQRVAALDASVASVVQSVDGSEARTAALHASLGSVAQRVEGSDARLEGLARTLASMAERIEATEGRAAALDASLTSVAQRVDGGDARLAGVAQTLASLAKRIEASDARAAALDASLTSVAQRVEGGDARLAELAQTVEAASARVLAIDEGTRGIGVQAHELATRVGSLEAVVEAATTARAQHDGQLAALGHTIEQETTRVSALGQDITAFRAQLEGIASGMRALQGQVAIVETATNDREQALAAHAARFEGGCRRVDALVAELRHALDTKPDEDAEIVSERLDHLGAELQRLSLEVERRAGGHETQRLRELVDGLHSQQATHERELADVAQGARARLAQLADLPSRIDALEARTASNTPANGDGRVRIELRALELRMEHAEAAVREAHDELLVRMERLASRIEARLQNLESEAGEVALAGVVDGDVIPIRTSEV